MGNIPLQVGYFLTKKTETIDLETVVAVVELYSNLFLPNTYFWKMMQITAYHVKNIKNTHAQP